MWGKYVTWHSDHVWIAYKNLLLGDFKKICDTPLYMPFMCIWTVYSDDSTFCWLIQ